MDIDKIPPMKPVLVEHVSDDISTLQKDDVTKQKTLLTARALEDIFKCAPIVATNATDAGYFVSGKVDLNKIVTASSRTITENQYINGPTLEFDVVSDSTKSDWSIKHSKETRVPHAFIYTFSVLDNTTLSWDHYENEIPIDDAFDEDDPTYRQVHARVASEKIRQIYIPNVPNEYYPNRPDETNAKFRSRTDLGTAWTRYGTLNADKTTYTWERWFKMGATHHGPEYFNQIVVGEGATIENPLYDSVYHVYNTGVNITLPNANLDGYFPGMKIVVEVHPAKTSGSELPSCYVHYTDTNNVGGEEETPMNIYITPKLRRNTKDIYGNVREDVQTTSVAVFELVELTDASGNTYRTWELDGGVEETDFVSGLAQMLSEHIDPATGDIVQYNREEIKSDLTVDILHPITVSGWAMARFLKRLAITDVNWTATVEIMTPQSDSDFTLVNKTETPVPVAGYIYYIKNGTTMSLAENGGQPTEWSSVNDYYSLNSTCAKTSIINFTPEGSSTVKQTIELADLTVGEWFGFSAFMRRNQVLHVKITSNKTVSEYRDSVQPTVYFFPDAHNSYIQKGSINPKAYTWAQLEKLFNTGGVINDTSFLLESITQSLANAPASTRALIDAYNYLAGKIQHRGQLLGNCARLKLAARGCDEIVTPGHFFITPEDDPAETNSYPPGLTDAGCNIIVVDNGHAPAGNVHEEDGSIVEPTQVVQFAVRAGTKAFIYTRIGTKEDESSWTWTDWRGLISWDDIPDLPLYFHSRWDYFESPDKLINKLDDDDVTVVHNTETNHCEVGINITQDEISSLMEASSNPAYDENVNYDVPPYLVGIRSLTPSRWIGQKTATETGIDYVVNVRLPGATLGELTSESKTRRRKIKFLLYGLPSTDWTQILFRLSYASFIGGAADYTYERNWGGSTESIIVMEFEQIDLPNGERVWAPHEIG